MTAAGGITVVDSPSGSEFELLDGTTVIGRALYLLHSTSEEEPDQVIFYHTEVDDTYAGQGLAARLAGHALDATVTAGRRIVPVCPYITTYLRKHREYADHVDQPTKTHLDALRAGTH